MSVVNSGLKADENRLRRRETDVISKLYDTIKKEQAIKVIQNS
jgi:hypothetical protein